MSETTRGHIAMLGFAIAVSGSFGLGGLAAPHLDPLIFTLLRFYVALAAMGALVAIGPGFHAAHFTRSPWRYPLLGSLMATYFVTMFEALQITDPVSTGAVFTLTPALAAGFGWLLLRQTTTPFNALAIAVGAAGALWVIFRGDLDAFLGFEVGLGEQIFFFGVAAHAFYTPLVRKLNRGEPVIVFAFGTILGATVLMSVWIGPRLGGVNWAALPAVVWVAILYTALAATAGSFLMLQFATLRLPSGKVMSYTYLTPTLVILWGAALGGGWAPATVWIGAALSAGALLMLAWR